MAVNLSHIPDVALDTRSGQLIEAYLKTWCVLTKRTDEPLTAPMVRVRSIGV